MREKFHTEHYKTLPTLRIFKDVTLVKTQLIYTSHNVPPALLFPDHTLRPASSLLLLKNWVRLVVNSLLSALRLSKPMQAGSPLEVGVIQEGRLLKL